MDEFYSNLNLKDPELVDKLKSWEEYYNYRRSHSSLNGKTPREKYEELKAIIPSVEEVYKSYVNDDAVFRSEMSNENTKKVLKDKVVNHVVISLLSFDALKVECMFNESQCKGTPILQAFCELVKVKYEAEGMILLDDAWMINVQDECSRYFEDVLGESRVIEDNYDI